MFLSVNWLSGKLSGAFSNMMIIRGAYARAPLAQEKGIVFGSMKFYNQQDTVNGRQLLFLMTQYRLSLVSNGIVQIFMRLSSHTF